MRLGQCPVLAMPSSLANAAERRARIHARWVTRLKLIVFCLAVRRHPGLLHTLRYRHVPSGPAGLQQSVMEMLHSLRYRHDPSGPAGLQQSTMEMLHSLRYRHVPSGLKFGSEHAWARLSSAHVNNSRNHKFHPGAHNRALQFGVYVRGFV